MQAIAQEPAAARAFQLRLVEESLQLLDTHLALGDNHLKATVRLCLQRVLYLSGFF